MVWLAEKLLYGRHWGRAGGDDDALGAVWQDLRTAYMACARSVSGSQSEIARRCARVLKGAAMSWQERSSLSCPL